MKLSAAAALFLIVGSAYGETSYEDGLRQQSDLARLEAEQRRIEAERKYREQQRRLEADRPPPNDSDYIHSIRRRFEGERGLTDARVRQLAQERFITFFNFVRPALKRDDFEAVKFAAEQMQLLGDQEQFTRDHYDAMRSLLPEEHN